MSKPKKYNFHCRLNQVLIALENYVESQHDERTTLCSDQCKEEYEKALKSFLEEFSE